MSDFKLALFDMDGTLVKDRTIFVFAEKKGFMTELENLIHNSNMEFYKKSIEIAKSLKGLDSRELLEIAANIPLNDNVEKVIKKLKEEDIQTGIVTDSYLFVAEALKKRLGMDFAFANNLIIQENIVTGDLEIHNSNLIKDPHGDKIYSICKSCVLDNLCEKLKIKPEQVLAIGDGKVDICMLEKAGLGIAFKASGEVQKHANYSINDMIELLDYI